MGDRGGKRGDLDFFLVSKDNNVGWRGRKIVECILACNCKVSWCITNVLFGLHLNGN